jgi:hypothetical protein
VTGVADQGQDVVAAFLWRWLDTRRASLEAGQPQDVAVSEVIEALPGLADQDPVSVGLRLLQVALEMRIDPQQLALVVDLGDAPGGLEFPQPPAEWSLNPESRQVQLHVTPPGAGSDRPVASRRIPLTWQQPSGFDRPLAISYCVARPIGPEFDDWEPAASLAIQLA